MGALPSNVTCAPVTKEKVRKQVEKIWGCYIGFKPGFTFTKAPHKIEEGVIKLLYVFGENPDVIENIMNVATTFTYANFIATMWSIIKPPIGSVISTPFIAIILEATFSMPFIIMGVLKANGSKPRKTDHLACGFKYNSRMQMAASPFKGTRSVW